MRKVYSKIWLQGVGGIIWVAGAGAAGVWMLHGGGFMRPAVAFSIAIACIALAMLSQGEAASGRTLIHALKFGAASGLALLLTALFVEFWWVTVSVACMFAICRGVRNEDTPAYG